MTDMIYFVRQNELSPIKIGWTSNITQRMSMLETAAPYGMTLLGTIVTQTAKDLEKHLHVKYASKRLRGEWFDISKEDVEKEIRTHDADYDDKLQRAILLMNEGITFHANRQSHSSIQDGLIFNHISKCLNEGMREKREFVESIMNEFNVSRPTVFTRLKNIQGRLNTIIDVYKEGTVVHWIPKQQVIA